MSILEKICMVRRPRDGKKEKEARTALSAREKERLLGGKGRGLGCHDRTDVKKERTLVRAHFGGPRLIGSRGGGVQRRPLTSRKDRVKTERNLQKKR